MFYVLFCRLVFLKNSVMWTFFMLNTCRSKLFFLVAALYSLVAVTTKVIYYFF